MGFALRSEQDAGAGGFGWAAHRRQGRPRPRATLAVQPPRVCYAVRALALIVACTGCRHVGANERLLHPPLEGDRASSLSW